LKQSFYFIVSTVPTHSAWAASMHQIMASGRWASFTQQKCLNAGSHLRIISVIALQSCERYHKDLKYNHPGTKKLQARQWLLPQWLKSAGNRMPEVVHITLYGI